VARAARGKGVEALALLAPPDLARLPSALVRLLEYADTCERKDMGEPDQRVTLEGRDGARSSSPSTSTVPGPMMATCEYQRPWLYPAQEQAIFCPERYAVIEASTKSGKTEPSDDERWQAPWEVTLQRVRALVGRTPALVDSSGLGDPILEQLQKGASNYEGYQFTAPSKQKLMEGLAVAIQQGQVRFPDGPIVHELENFEYVYTHTGVQYSAPAGLHDDGVRALALAWQRFAHRPARPRITWSDEYDLCAAHRPGGIEEPHVPTARRWAPHCALYGGAAADYGAAPLRCLSWRRSAGRSSWRCWRSRCPLTGNGLNQPHGIAAVGSNQVWVVNAGTNTISRWQH
jgi:hypothetical protein